MTSMWDWTAYGRTDRGLVRRTNQDTFFVDNRHRLWAVADGMGGHAGGDVASQIVMDTLANFAPTMRQTADDDEEDATFHLTTMVKQAHTAILTHADHHPFLEGMGTTLVAAHLLRLSTPRVLVVNVGDSRAYLVRDRTIVQVTRDHTWIEEQIRNGHLTPNEAAHHPDRHVLTRAMGLGSTIEIDVFPYDVVDGDLLLLCSDGLTKMLPDSRILQTVLPHRRNPPLATQALVGAALEEGGIDNITVIACTMTERPNPGNRH
ncbi:MAG: putative Protein phosphatase [Nitrospira sp.]|jgi:protein phosphatase|nr:putative Protein phosphatase [Nitrospira sp.]